MAQARDIEGSGGGSYKPTTPKKVDTTGYAKAAGQLTVTGGKVYVPPTTPTKVTPPKTTPSNTYIKTSPTTLTNTGNSSKITLPTTPKATTATPVKSTVTTGSQNITNANKSLGNTGNAGAQQPSVQNQAQTGVPSSNGQQQQQQVSQSQDQSQQANQQGMGSQAVDSIDNAINGLSQLSSDMSKYGAEGQAALAAQYGQMTAMIDQLSSQILGNIQSQMGADDPALKAAIGLIRDEVEQQRQSLLDDLNARGLSQSGIVLEMQDRLNKGELTQVQQLVASRTADLQNQLNSAIMNIANMRMSALSNYQNNSATFMNSNMDRLTSIGLNQASLNMQAAGLQQDAYNNQQNRNQQLNIANMQNATERYGIDTNASTSKYNTDKDYAASIYNADKDYSASIYGANKSYAASVYGADKSYKAATASPEQEYQSAQAQYQSILTNYKNGTSDYNKEANPQAAAIKDIQSSGFSPWIKDWMIKSVQADFSTSSTPKTTTPKITTPSSSTYTPKVNLYK